MPKTFFGAIADDFAGAMDLAATLARTGVSVTLRIGVPGPGTDDDAAAAFEVVALDIRTVPPEDAVIEARAALRWLRMRGAERIFWKYGATFDSTARGNIGPVADALLSDLKSDRTIHCPASPERDVRVFMGTLFVGERPLDESPMKDHPLTPMRDANLMRLLTPQVQRQVGHLAHPVIRAGTTEVGAALEKLSGHVIMDAAEDADLSVIAGAVRDMPLVCGASGVARSLATLWRAAGTAPTEPVTPPVLPAGTLVLCGSCSAATRAQVGAYLERADGYRLDPLELLQGQLADARAWLRGRDPLKPKMVFATAEPKSVRAAQDALGSARAGALVEDALARLACDARDLGIGRIVVAGGETGAAVTRALGVDRLAIGPEAAPGVPWCFTRDGMALALKSGDAGGRDFFAEALELLVFPEIVAAQ